MADLDSEHRAVNSRFIRRGRLLEPVTGAGNGTWQRIRGCYPATICVGGTAPTVTWRVLVSNQTAAPTDNNHPQLGEDMDVLGIVQITAPFEWVNVVPVSIAGGNFFADIFAG